MANGTPIALPHARDVLVVKPSSFGDIIHTLPAVHALKRAYPGVRFHWAVNAEWAPLLEGNPDISSVLAFPRRQLRGLRAPMGFLKWCRSCRASVPSGFDLAIDFQGLLRSVLIARGCGARSIAGLSDAREGSGLCYAHRANVAGIYHAVDRYLALAAILGGDRSQPLFPLPLGESLDGVDPEKLQPAMVLHPFARGTGKSLPVPMVEKIIHAMAPTPVVLLGVGGPTSHTWPSNTLNLLHQTNLAQLIWVMRHVAGVVSVDSGPMHLAAALSVPLLGLHTWSDPRKVGPWNPKAQVWKAGKTLTVADLPAQEDTWCLKNEGWDDTLPEAIATWASTWSGQ